MPQELENVLRLLLAALIGGLIGVERERNEQPAGLRTNLLVALGACLFTLMSAYGIDRVTGDLRNATRFDPSRVVSQVVVGIGFLGAGAILKQGVSIRGLTTAASLWVVAAIGTAIGLGSYTLGLTAAAVAVLALYALRPARRWVRHLGRDHEELLVRGESRMEVEPLLTAVREAGGRDIRLEVDVGEDATRSVMIDARYPGPSALVQVIGRIAAIQGVHEVVPADSLD